MISQRMLSSDICGNALKSRVSACRKRLRARRTTQRPPTGQSAAQLFPETPPPLLEFTGYQEPTASMINANHASLVPGARDSEASLAVAEYEVGIT